MPIVNTTHPIYDKLKARWAMVRDAVEGEWAIKAAKEVYLPKLLGTGETEYDGYILRALFLEATRRTLQGLVGMIMQKSPQIEAKDGTKEIFLKSVTKSGMSMNGFASVVLQEVIMLNKYGILADLPDRISAETEPWLVGYNAESILNWEFITIDGKSVPSRIVLQEEWHVHDPDDRFKQEFKDQWRVLELVDGVFAQRSMNEDIPLPDIPATQDFVYRVQVWRKRSDTDTKGTTDEFILWSETFPAHLGTAIDRIPFVIVTAEDEDKEDQKPPLEGLASVNISHYRSSADLEHGRHFTALPTPYVIGLSQQQSLTIGSAKAWIVEGVNASEVEIGMLEFTGKGLASLETAMSEKESQMARLGSRLMEAEKKSSESFETHRLKSAGENSILASIANGVSGGLNEALDWMELWDPSLGEISIQLNTEFVSIPISAQELTAFISALQSGKMSFKVFYFNMQERGMYPEDHTEEDELKLLEDEAETFGGEVDDLGDVDDEDVDDEDVDDDEEDEEDDD